MLGFLVRVLIAFAIAAFASAATQLAFMRPVLAQSDNIHELHRRSGELYQSQRYEEAAALLERLVALLKLTQGEDHIDYGVTLYNLANVYRAQGRYAEAIPFFERALAIHETVRGPQSADVADIINHLAFVYETQGRFADTIPLHLRALAINENIGGPDHPMVAQTLNNLALAYGHQGRSDEALRLNLRALAIREKAFGPQHLQVAQSLNNLGLLYLQLGEHDAALRHIKRALDIKEKALGPNHPDVEMSQGSLAVIYDAQGKFAEAAPLWARELAAAEKVRGRNHPAVTNALDGLGNVYRAQRKYAEAIQMYERSLAIKEMALGPHHPSLAATLRAVGLMELERDRFADAVTLFRRGTAILASRRQIDARDDKRIGDVHAVERLPFFDLTSAAWQLSRQQPNSHGALARETFEASQLGERLLVATALAQAAVRLGTDRTGLGTAVRARQDLVAQWQALERRLVAIASEARDTHNATAIARARIEIAAVVKRISALDQRLASEFPDYWALTNPKPLSVEEVQGQLGTDEALVTILTAPEAPGTAHETFIWIVTKIDFHWVRLELGKVALSREVAALRCGLDATSWYGDGAKRCAALLKLPADAAPSPGDTLPFDAARAHTLYMGLLGDVTDLIKGKHLLVVPSGALTTLPFQVLVTEQPGSNDLAAIRWLIRDHALTVLPSIASLKALRRTAKPSAAPKPMIGFGNPLLDGDQRHPRYGAYYRQQAQLARAQTGCAPSQAKRTAALRVVARSLNTSPPPGGRFADLGHLRVQVPLPETADELCEVVRTVGGNVDDVRLGGRATETEVKRLSASGKLAKYRILHFATHGTLAGQLTGTNEPGLILTPPATATPEDDGYLSGSEIASLKLDANWVILSACNTAGGAVDGEAAEALSGLARTFFYAGARALLVSHWEVDSDAAVKLVTRATGALSKEPNIGRAEALRRAMLAMIADDTRPKNWVPASHPSVWAPFVVVGEGGARR